jgi:preprotein translocase SecE subunit
MENNQKWVNLSFLAGAALVAFIVFLLANKGAAVLDFEGRIHNLNVYLRAGALVVGAIVFFVLYRNKVANAFLDEVFIELVKVTWPAREETFKGTIAVIIAVTIMGFMFGFVDWIWSHLVTFIL